MKILFINNHGGGFAGRLDIPDGLSVAAFFCEQVPYGKPSDFLIRVNRQEASADQVLRDGDRVSITPIKIEGAT